jgi:hypothetical protein
MPSTSDEKRQSRLAAFRNTDRIAGISCASTPRPSAYVISFSVIVPTNTSGRARMASRSVTTPSMALPSAS